MRALLLVLVVAGCFPHQFARTSRGDRQLEPIVVERIYPLAFEVHRFDPVLVVNAVLPRTCRRDVIDVIATETGTRYASNTTSSIKRYRVPVDVVRRPCSLPAADTALVLTFANGDRVTGHTDAAGAFVLMLPDSLHGQAVAVTAAGAKPEIEVPPVEPPPRTATASMPEFPQREARTFSDGIAAVRDVVVRCGNASKLKGVERIRLFIRGGKVRGELATPHEVFASCVERGLSSVTFPKETTLELTMAFLVGK